MIRILKILFILAIFGSATAEALGQDVEFTAATKNNVQVGEQFRLVYTVNQQADRFQGPDFEGFNMLSGPNQSTSQSYQFINGKVSQSYQVTYTYYLQATKAGTFSIGPGRITIGSKSYQSNSLTINVSQSSSPQSSAPQSQSNSNQRSSQPKQGTANKNDIFIKAIVDKSEPYQGEQVIITYKLYTTVPISQININKISSFPGFWNKSLLNDNDPLKQSNETINGKEYVVADLRKIALFAQRSGTINIEPMELQFVAQIKSANSQTRDPFFDNFFNDPFFNRSYQNVEMKTESNPVSIDVKPLPTNGKPLDFSGAVGNFNISANIDRTELKSNEPINLKITVSGKGNLELIDALPVSFPPDFETYDPKVTDNIVRSASGISGSRTFEYLVIPRNPGEFQIKPVEFSYFDPARQSYTTLSTPMYNIKVNKGTDQASGVTYSGISQKNIQFIGSDIRYIKTGFIELQRIGSFLISSTAFIFWLLIPALLFIAFIILWSKNKKRKGNIALVRNRQANKVARKNLQKASEYLQKNSTEAFFEEISRALWGYISNKFNIPLADLSIETVYHKLSDKSISAESISKFTDVLGNCEFARFAPGDKSGKMQEIYNEALEVISKIEQELK